MSTTPPKRPRPVLSCWPCRSKKLRCDRLLPCEQCVKYRRVADCIYGEGQEPERRPPEDSVPGAAAASPDRPSKRARRDCCDQSPQAERYPLLPRATMGVVEDLQARVAKLENILGQRDASQSSEGDHSIPMAENGLDSERSGTRPIIYRDSPTVHVGQNRRFAISSPFAEAKSFMERLPKPSRDSEMWGVARDLRQLQKIIKSQQRVHLRLTNNTARPLKRLIDLIPDQVTAFKLIDIYFQNFEQCHRIFHQPTFSADVEAVYSSARQEIEHSDIVPQLLGVIAVAAPLGVEAGVPLYNTDSFREILQLLKIYLDNLRPQDQLQLSALRLRLLMLLSHTCELVPSSELWNMSGTLVRYAMSTGLHRDPSEGPMSEISMVSVFEAEIRRRLWYTIVEQDLQISLLCNLPALVSSSDFTCQPASNFNDSDLYPDMSRLPPPRPPGEWTDTLCQCSLAQSLRDRLDAYRMVSGGRILPKYENVKRRARRMEDELRGVDAALKFDNLPDTASRRPGRLIGRMMFDMVIRRLLVSLYTPYASAYAATEDDDQQCQDDARSALVQSAYVILCYQDLFDPKFSELETSHPEIFWDFFYAFYTHDVVRATMSVCLELQMVTSIQRYPHLPAAKAPLRIGGGTRRPLPINRASSSVTSTTSMPPPSNSMWTKATLIKSVEDTLEPLVRRIARAHSSVKELACLTLVLASVKNSSNKAPEHKEALMKESLNELVLHCQRQLEKEGIATTPPPPSTATMEAVDPAGEAGHLAASERLNNVLPDALQADYYSNGLHSQFFDEEFPWMLDGSGF